MEDLTNKIACMRDTIKKIKNEIKTFKNNESKNSQNRTNTFSNKIYRHSTFTGKTPFIKFNKRLLKNYFKISRKEQNYYNKKNHIKSIKKINNNSFKQIITPHHINKVANRIKISLTSENLKNSKNFKNNTNFMTSNTNITNNNYNDNNNLYKSNFLIQTDINNTINNNIYNYDDSCMNKNLFQYIKTRKKDFSEQQKEIKKKQIKHINKIINTYSSTDLKKDIFSNYLINNKNNKKELLYNESNNYNINYNENILKNYNNSAYFNFNKSNINNKTENRNRTNLLTSNLDEKYLFQARNKKLNNNKNNPKFYKDKNNSFNIKVQLNHNLTHTNNNIQYPINNPEDCNKSQYYNNSYRAFYFDKNFGNFTFANDFLNYKNFTKIGHNCNLDSYFFNKKSLKSPKNNTINYIKNNNNIELISENDDNNINKNKIKNIIGNHSIGDLYIKAKLFEKCGKNNFTNFVNNFCSSNDLIDNLKKYKNFLIKIREEEYHYKKQINIYQKICKKFFELMNQSQINDIINEIHNISENKENSDYIIRQIKTMSIY